MKKIMFVFLAAAVILVVCAIGGIAGKHPSSSNSSMNTNLLDSIDSANSPFEKGYYDYEGTKNNNLPIQMSIYPLDQEIVGSYSDENQGKEIQLKGKAGANDIVLYEYDETGKNTAVFKGTMHTIDQIEGTWIKADGKTSYPFTLSLRSNLPGVEYGKRYATAVGTVSDQEVESFVGEIQESIRTNKKEQLANEIRYPITVKINGKDTVIATRDEFVEVYSLIVNSDFKEAMSKASTKYLFANSQGVMFGDGQYNLWIKNAEPSAEGMPKLVIIAINN